jgi:hypothetical protein
MLKKGEVTFHRKQDVLLVSHHDKRLVNMISTLHTAADTADQYLVYYPFIHKTVKWPKKVFFYLLQCALSNSYVIFTKSNPNSHQSLLDYLVDVNKILIQTTERINIFII